MTPGSLFLGNATQYFECSHEHRIADRCISFSYEAPYFEALVAEAGVRGHGPRFQRLRVPPAREMSALIARAVALAANGTKRPCDKHRPATSDWEGIGVELAAAALSLANRSPLNGGSSPATEARVTRVVRMIEEHPETDHGLSALAQEARLSRYHFLRVFQRLTGLTPHQYVRRARLRRAATRLMLDQARVLDIALDSGFGDISNFNHAFREEFAVSPVAFRTCATSSINSPPHGPSAGNATALAISQAVDLESPRPSATNCR